MTVKYSPMCKEHIKAVAQIEKECFCHPWSEDAFYDELDNPLSLTIVAMLTDNVPLMTDKKHVAGFVNARIINGEVYINNIAVSKVYRQKGIGKGLLTSLENTVRNKGALFITLEVRESNSAAISLYKTLGYKYAGLRKRFYRDPAENAVLMTKELN